MSIYLSKPILGTARFRFLCGIAWLATLSCPIVPLSAQEAESADGFDLEELLDAGQALWESLAPSEIQEAYRLPTFEEVTQFLTTIESSLADGDAQSLAPYTEPAKQILLLLRGFEGGDELADWLQPRIDYLVASDEIQNAPLPRIAPRRPRAPPVGKPVSPQFTQQYWSEVIARRPKPKLADRYIPVFKKAFKSKGVPTELVWLSEVESAIKLKARSPVGAYGPFQFMPATAKRFGLRVGLFDERSNPRKSAEAAATYLSILYQQFKSWPLALAAYNAGEGRVGRALKSTGAKEFQQVSSSLPTETRMYVPKVLATVALRESIDSATLSSILSFSDSGLALHASSLLTADPPDSYR